MATFCAQRWALMASEERSSEISLLGVTRFPGPGVGANPSVRAPALAITGSLPADGYPRERVTSGCVRNAVHSQVGTLRHTGPLDRFYLVREWHVDCCAWVRSDIRDGERKQMGKRIRV